ncbi:MAG: hypothetical protein A2046_01220 [Bacteroidetes bacterium GWA2_30_7]|nr:MAG: hypothetical protein A2046_01220 [Bacteroidetes bacterium GWA2_30_7]
MTEQKEDILYTLIKSLTSSEKGYFKKFIKGFYSEENKEYLKLFEIYDKANLYNEFQINKQITKFIGNKRIDIFKSYLYETILKSLRAYNSNSNINIQIAELLADVEILLKKGLFNLASKKLHIAEKLAISYHKLKNLLIIKEFEKKILLDSQNINQFKATINKIHNDEFRTINQLKTFYEYNKLDSQTFLLNRIKPKARNNSEATNFSEIINSRFMMDIKLADSIPSKLLYHSIYVSYYYAINDSEKSLSENSKIIELLDNNPELKKELHIKYIYTLHNQIAIATKLKKFSIASKYLEMLKSENSRNNREKLKIAEFIFILELNLLLKSENLKSASEVVKKIESYLKNDSNKIQNNIIIYHLISLYYFECQQYSNALKWVNNIINSSNNDIRTDLYSFAKIFSIIIHYELENYEIIEHLLKSAKRHLEKNNHLYKIEEILIQKFKLLVKTHNSVDLRKIFNDLSIKFNELKNENQGSEEFHFYHNWINNKINN